jgi:hypothetical protein
MEVANTLAYYDTSAFTAVKSILVQALGGKICFSKTGAIHFIIGAA